MSTVESDQTPQRRGLYHRCFRTGYLRARGLGVMTSPSHGEDRRFNSGRAHHILQNNLARLVLFGDVQDWFPNIICLECLEPP